VLISVALALGIVKIIQLIKEILPWPVEAWVKSALTLALAGLGALPFVAGPGQWVLVTGGAAGLAGLIHQVTRFVTFAGDRAKTDVIVRTMGRVRR
jgi:hypothetical protein